ncbi:MULTISPECIES: HVO_2523 family zinc finger protein [Haloprofundus]|uniref:HVO_2523 family zinc finger protein n=1 Tax=Haloprofundus TaxID=1911573 RepID=UPI00143D3DF8|nr:MULTISPECIES: HVO_2523 family zinc finger protein [Haloprofundus]
MTETTEESTRQSRSETDSEETPRGRPCPFCGASMQHRHCKYVCPTHGVVYDCSDTFW